MRLQVKLSLCRITNSDCANCRGFDLSVHRGFFYLNAHWHSTDKSIFIDGYSYSMSYQFPAYFSLRLFYKDTQVIRISPTSLSRLMEKLF